MIVIIALIASLSSCENDPTPNNDFLPEKFSVDIPTAISSEASAGRTKADTLNGNAVYLNLATFIAVGAGSAHLVEDFISGIRRYALEHVETATFTSDDDKRKKNLVVQKDVAFEGKTWQFMLTVTDADSENNADGGLALQIFWNHGTPIHGVAVVKPYNCNRNDNGAIPDALFRINYDEQTDAGYDAQMEVSISGMPLPANAPYAISTLRMFAGKKGDVVDVFGNSSHPNASFFSGQKGFGWAFVASGSDSENIGVAEVGLPPLTLDESDRVTLLKTYSIKTVFTNEVQTAFPFIPQHVINAYLKNTSAPGYFNNTGFVAGGKSPGPAWDALADRLDALSPYNPKATATLAVSFKE